MGDHTQKYHLEDEFRQFFDFLREGKVNVRYSPQFREFSITLKESPAAQLMTYCPWAGKEFPKSLRDAYFDTLETEYNFTEPSLDDIREKRVPEEMLSEEWWVKRNL